MRKVVKINGYELKGIDYDGNEYTFDGIGDLVENWGYNDFKEPALKDIQYKYGGEWESVEFEKKVIACGQFIMLYVYTQDGFLIGKGIYEVH